MTHKTNGIVVRAILAFTVAVVLTMSFAPGLAKPLLVKYYRSIYSADVVRPS